MPNLYSDLISLCRQDTGDFGIRRYETADGDAVTSVFNLLNPKVLEGSYSFTVGGVTQTENTAYVLYPDQGQLIWQNGHIPAVGNDNVAFNYQSVNFRDADYVDLINQVLLLLRKKLWIEFYNQTDASLLTVLDKVDYALSAIAADILQISNVEYQTSATAPWQDVKGLTNVILYRDLQILHMRPAIQVSGYQMRIKGIRAYALGTSSSSTLEVQTKFWPIIRKYVEALYWERMATKASGQTSAVSKETTFEDMKTLKKLASDLRKEADQMFKAVRPVKPPTAIANAVYGVNI